MLLTSRCDSFICFDRSTSVAFGQQENVGKYTKERETNMEERESGKGEERERETGMEERDG